MRIVVPVVVLALNTACSSGPEPAGETTAPATTVASTTTSTLAPPASPAPASTTTSTTASVANAGSAGEVGSRDALLAAIEIAIRETEDFYDYDPGDVPIPDLTNPDPSVALREILLFDAWVFATAPASDWTSVYTYPGGPYEGTLVRIADRQFLRPFVFDDPSARITIQTIRAASSEEMGAIPASIADEAPNESIVLVASFSIGAYDEVDIETGQVLRRYEGESGLTGIAIIAPTAAGWTIFFFQ